VQQSPFISEFFRSQLALSLCNVTDAHMLAELVRIDHFIRVDKFDSQRQKLK